MRIRGRYAVAEELMSRYLGAGRIERGELLGCVLPGHWAVETPPNPRGAVHGGPVSSVSASALERSCRIRSSGCPSARSI